MKARVADGWLIVGPVTSQEAARETFISATHSVDHPDWQPAYFAQESLRIRPPAGPGAVVNVRVRIGRAETMIGRLVL